ncbi:4Fe-4S ferredoxin [Pullulanibacillus camelliae]|uniref:Ferredoxin n=1 Tax=Pullulanibacillus camelliae TaxID=1707096 RepID=A0A8J2VLU5_9BACL|nr:ferredoxin family protein [Pullulanibacillus camelliae]GGE31646.1 4Fe-4S ferredoxin [Pullulanibacillus camelliae]
MAFVVTSRCVGEKWAECVEVCPVDCIKEGSNMYFIDPDVCIDCGACASACPTEAIYESSEVPREEQAFIRYNKEFFSF